MTVQVLPFGIAEQGEVSGGKVQVLFADFDGGVLHGQSLSLQQVKAL
jgi:hypothetical protein